MGYNSDIFWLGLISLDIKDQGGKVMAGKSLGDENLFQG
jgi:hypothetical protein